MARILIAGCGDVGSQLGLLLADEGHEVWGLRRSPQNLPASVRPFAADLSQPETLTDLPAGLDQVFYTAAATGRTDDAYRAAYVEGPRHLIAALHRGDHAIDRFLFTSSTGVYGQDAGEWVDEASATHPLTFTGRHLVEGEAVVRSSPWTTVVARLAGIYGPGRNRLIHRAREGAAIVRQPPSYTNRIHRDDCASMLAHLRTIDSPNPVYIGVDHAPAPLAEVIDWICDQQGWRVPPDAAPGQESRRTGNKRCSNQRLLASGYSFHYPTYREGYGALL